MNEQLNSFYSARRSVKCRLRTIDTDALNLFKKERKAMKKILNSMLDRLNNAVITVTIPEA